MTKRKPVAVALLPFVTFGISALVWVVKSKGEMVSKRADIPTSWLIIVPFAGIWYLWKWSQGVEKVTNKGMSSMEAFLVMLFLGSIGHAIVQSKFNKVV